MPKTKRQRSRALSYRVPKDLEDEFAQRVAKSGLSVNAFITQSWYGKPVPRQVRRAPVEQRLLSQWLGLGAVIVDRLKTFDAIAADGQDITLLLQEVRCLLTEIRNSIFLLMGRKP